MVTPLHNVLNWQVCNTDDLQQLNSLQIQRIRQRRI